MSSESSACLSVNCGNGGTINNVTCQCLCSANFTGLECETEIGRSAWPAGQYAIPMSGFGCPEMDRFGWTRGYVNLTLPQASRKQLWNDDDLLTIEPHIMGPFHTHVMMINFCLKQNTSMINSAGSSWPAGDYCIYKSGDECPLDFVDGSITINGYTFTNGDMGGILPSLSYGEGNDTFLELHYCCRNDGHLDDEISLPSEFPFVLLKGSSAKACQNVSEMDVMEEVFYMTNEHDNWEFSGHYTNVTRKDRHVGVPYCYYKPKARRECYYPNDHGASYNGRHNTSASGKSCVRWSELPDDPYATTRYWVYEREENYCGTVDYTPEEKQPMCFVGMETREKCDVPICVEDPDLEVIESGKPAYSFKYYATNDPFLATDGIIGDVSFVTTRPQLKPFLQVDIQEWYEVHAILIHRKNQWFPVNCRQLGSFVSKNQWDFLDYGATRCDDIRFTTKNKVFRLQCMRPIVGRYITIRNFDSTDTFYNAGKFYFLEINEMQIIGKKTGRGQHMGLMSGDVFDYQIDSSSNIAEDIMSDDGRLELPGRGWCPAVGDTSPWFRVDFIIPVVVQGLRIQGWQEGNTRKLTKQFTVKYGNDLSNLTTYYDPPGIIKVFETFDHYESSAIQDFNLNHEVMTRFIHLDILGTQNDACLKLEVIGCPKRSLRAIRCENGSLDFGFEELKYHSWWAVFPPENVISNVSLEECRQLVVDKGYNSYSYDARTIICIVHVGHRYYRSFTSSWVRDSMYTNLAGNRLCFQDITDMSQCGEDIYLAPGEGVRHLRSPSFPLSYGQHINCAWVIKASPGKFIKLEAVYISLGSKVKWNDIVKAGDTTEDVIVCSDEIKIYRTLDAHITISHATKTATVQQFQKSTIFSSSSTLHVEVNSCFLYSKSKERNFEFAVEESDVSGCGLESGQCIITCTLQSAYIGTPGFPADISMADTCSWTIHGTFGNFVRLHILNLDIVDSNRSCVKSFIAVYDVTLDGELSLLSKMCSADREYNVLVSSWHTMQIEFRAGDGSGKGFFGKYELVDSAQTEINITDEGCLPGWTRLAASCYNLFTEINNHSNSARHGVSWIQSRDHCAAKGGYLVSIGSVEEMTYIHYLMTKVWGGVDNGEAYIGLQKIFDDEDVKYEWLDGTPLTYTAWFKDPRTSTSQPDGLASERCTVIRLFSINSLDNWHDIACAYDRIPSYICEMSSSTDSNETNRQDIFPATTATSITNSSGFHCNNGEDISRQFVCDGKGDCRDSSDEHGCGVSNTTCAPHQFRCNDGKCISLSLFCDFIPHCQDKSDETNCVHHECEPGEFRCKNGHCLPEHMVCDLKEDCKDGSDEDKDDCETCRAENFLCYDQTCIRGSRQCDGNIDCGGRFSEDESQQCERQQHSSCTDLLSLGIATNGEYLVTLGTETTVRVECTFSTSNDKTSVKTIVHHDHEEWRIGVVNNIDDVIEYRIPMSHIDILKKQYRCSQKIRLKCHMSPAVINQWQGGNGVWHDSINEGQLNGTCSCPMFHKCDTQLDRCNCTTEFYDWYVVGVNDVFEDSGDIAVQDDLPIIGIAAGLAGGIYSYLGFKVDPLVCENDEIGESARFLCRSGISVDKSVYCLMDYDEYGEIKGCRDLSHLDYCSDFECPPDFAKCSNSYCIPVRFLCDDEKHCSNGEDEDMCDRTCVGLFRCHKSDVCLGQVQVCDGIPNCPEGDDEDLCNVTCPSGCTCNELTAECNNITVASNDTFAVFSNIRKLSFKASDFSLGIPKLKTYVLAELNLSRNSIKHLTPENFENLNNIYTLDLSHNALTSIVAETFHNLRNLRTLHLHGNTALRFIHPDAFAGLSVLPSLIIHQTLIKKIASKTFVGLDQITVLNLTQNRITQVEDFAFASLKELSVLDIRSNNIQEFSDGIFNGLTNLKELYTDAYMFCCVKPETVTDKNCHPYQDEFSSCSDLMREDHLRSFLWIIGCLSLLGNAGVIIYKVIYDRRSLKKGHGIFIMNLGCADFLMGVYMLIIAIADTMFRGRYIWNDIYWRNSIICKFAGVLATVSSEASVMFLLLITIDRFVSVKFVFGQIQFTKRKAMFTCMGVWLITWSIAVLPLFPIKYFKGQFYSRSAVCLALPLTREWPAGWEYGTAIFIFVNFIIFISIAIGQVLIYKEVSSTHELIKSQRRSQDAAIARSLFLVVFSDFLCWFPLGIMGLMALSGHHIPPAVYAWAAVFVLPINSALNPILYTFSAIIRQRKNSRYRASTKTAISRLSTSTSTPESIWSDICNSDKFIIGAELPCHLTLKEYTKEGAPDVGEIYKIVTDLAGHLDFLHRRKLLHGSVSDEMVIVTRDKNKKLRAYSRLDPSVVDEEAPYGYPDIEAMGRVVIKLLRWNQRTSGSRRKTRKI
ncbi:G-protein coupled receptor GRL101 [Mizuhopecten yessoensis]|uniref:G-protein coupled receptor GRL101 n=1 Tax=Mizuhopecten yessoensis TaxID=6573 RepID=A0A210PF06_MIZYE|nr:G-protein coupled receptor GRL101 [Mizuhopecten yessoensis]